MPIPEKATTGPLVEAHRVLLSEEQEKELFNKWYAAEGRVKDVYLSQIVRSYSPIIKSTIREFSGYHADPEELTSEGLMALVQAARRFDISKGNRFSTFAKSWVRGVMLGFITKNYFPVNLCTSHNKKKLFFAIRRTIAANLKANGSFEMTHDVAEKLAEEYSVNVRDVNVIYEMIRKPPVSMEDPVHRDESGSMTRQDFVQDNDPLSSDSVVEHNRHVMQRKLIDDVISTVLDDRERHIFEKQVLSQRDESMTLEELGEKWNVSRERVRQLRNKATKRVKAEVLKRVDLEEFEAEDII